MTERVLFHATLDFSRTGFELADEVVLGVDQPVLLLHLVERHGIHLVVQDRSATSPYCTGPSGPCAV